MEGFSPTAEGSERVRTIRQRLGPFLSIPEPEGEVKDGQSIHLVFASGILEIFDVSPLPSHLKSREI